MATRVSTYGIKTPISFWCRRGLNLKSLIQLSETLLIKLTGTHTLIKAFNVLRKNIVIYSFSLIENLAHNLFYNSFIWLDLTLIYTVMWLKLIEAPKRQYQLNLSFIITFKILQLCWLLSLSNLTGWNHIIVHHKD